MKRTGTEFACLTCGAAFYRTPYRIRLGHAKFCSLGCRKHTPAVKEKIAATRRGKPAWNSGLSRLTDPRLNYYRPTKFASTGKCTETTLLRRSTEMRNWRTQVFARDNYTCTACGIRGGALNADHIKPFSKFPSLRFELSNGRTMCVACHKQTPTYGGRCNRKNTTNGTSYYSDVGLGFA